MRGPIRIFALLVLCLGLTAARAGEPPKVVASIKPIHALLAGLMQGLPQPVLLIDGGIPPWQYRPAKAQRAALSAADLIVWTGPELEPGLADALKAVGDGSRVVEVLASDALKVLPSPEDHTRRDAYFWLDSRNMLILLDELARTLSRIDPANSVLYERNRDRLHGPMVNLDRALEFGYRDVGGLPVFFYHDTHSYFAQAYAMKIAGTVAGAPGTGPGDAAGLIRLKGWLAQPGEHCLFTEKGADASNLDLALTGSDVEPVELDSLGSRLEPGPDLYAELMRRDFEAIADCVRPATAQSDMTRAAGTLPDEVLLPEEIQPRYLLMDQFGRTVSPEDFTGKLQLILFGYTGCPDVCPISTSTMARVLTLLGPQADEVQPIFISVDPERDTPDVLKRYLAYFNPRILGLSGSPEMTKRTAENFKARYEKVRSKNSDPGRYSVDHTASLYLLGREGQFLAKLAYGMPAEQIAQRLRDELSR